MTAKKEKLSVRLTNDMRAGILTKVLKNAFNKEAEELENKRFALSEKVYNDFYDKATRDKINSLPKGWLPEKSSIYIVFGDSSSGYCERNFKEPKLMLTKDTERRALKIYPYEHKLTIEHTKVTKEVEEFKARKQKATNEAKAIVDSCNTTAQLKEVWPSIADIIEGYEPSRTEGKPGTQVAPVLTELNKILGLK